MDGSPSKESNKRFGGGGKQRVSTNRITSGAKVTAPQRKPGQPSQRVNNSGSRRQVSTYGHSSAMMGGAGSHSWGQLPHVEVLHPDGVTRLDVTPQSLLKAAKAQAKLEEAAKAAAALAAQESQSEMLGISGRAEGKDKSPGKDVLARKESTGLKKTHLNENSSFVRMVGKSTTLAAGKNRMAGAAMSFYQKMGSNVKDYQSQVSTKEDFDLAAHVDPEEHERRMKQKVAIVLSETPTSIILHIAGHNVPNDFKDYEQIKMRNEKYKAMVEARKHSDNYTVRHTQTLNWSQKDKEALAIPPATSDAQCEASAFDIFDAMQKEIDMDRDELDQSIGQLKHESSSARLGVKITAETAMQRQIREVVAVTLSRPGCLLDATQAIIPPPPAPIGQPVDKQGGLRIGAGTNSGNVYGDSGPVNNPIAYGGRGGGNTRMGAANAGAAAGSGYPVPSAPANKAQASSGHTAAAIEEVNPKEILAQQEADKILNSHELFDSLRLVERAIQQNLFHSHHITYRDYPVEEMEEQEAQQEDDPSINPRVRIGSSFIKGATTTLSPRSTSGDVDGRQFSHHRLTDNDKTGKSKHDGTEKEEENESGEQTGAISDGDEEGDGSTKPWLQKLFTFKQTESNVCKTVTSMCWNQASPDVLAVSYGCFHYSPGLEGRVYFWSLRNPEFPERVLKMESPCTTIDFSKSHPNLLAVGMYNGAVAVYDTAREHEDFHVPMRESSTSAGKHTDPVWQVRWLDKGVERGETLVSISTDGRIVEWSMKKGLTYTPLMVLKCVGNTEGVISRQAGGICLDFPVGDAGTYFAGTEDGVIHKCSPSYNEQSLETFLGHTAPVYRLRCSPFWRETFLSCSADWSVKLWVQKETAPVYTFLSTDLSDEVCDVNWSPTNSTLFASVTADGRIELWDLSVSTLDPIVRKFKKRPKQPERPNTAMSRASDRLELNDDDLFEPKRTQTPTEPVDKSKADKIKLTGVSFALNAPILTVGDSEGLIDVYRIHNIDTHPEISVDDQIKTLKEKMFPEDLSSKNARRNS